MKRLVLIGIFFFAFLASALQADAAPISRYDLLERACKAFWNRSPDEAAVLRSGLLAPFPDKRIHPDWPATRGTALVILAALVESSITPEERHPGEFTDLQPDTPLGSAAALIGGWFEPTAKRRFSPDRLVSESELEELLDLLQNDVTLPAAPPGWLSAESGTAVSAAASEPAPLERRFPVEFRFRDSSDAESAGNTDEEGASDARRIERLRAFVPDDQIAPQGEFNLTEALDGMNEIENLLEKLEVTVQDLTTLEVPPERVTETLDAFDQIGEILGSTTDKLRFSRKHLEAALLTDPARLRDATGLRSRIVDGLRRVAHLKEKIDARRPTLAATRETPR
ncbi:MAG TPA: hypothetical protein PLP29_08190 [Candidatus Ozemobacteraceae bacterium]|nr:hypothetical protein [Candidatus Ozemobacteraceae bacterium]